MVQRVRDWWLWLGEDDLRVLLVFSWGICVGVCIGGAVAVATVAGALSGVVP
jgi:hypothetical protein